MLKHVLSAAALLGMSAMLSASLACRYAHINVSMKALDRESVLRGSVQDILHTLEPGREGPPVVVRVFDGDSPRSPWIAHRVMRSDDHFYFVLESGSYGLDAFEDTNGNLQPDVGERVSPFTRTELDERSDAELRLRIDQRSSGLRHSVRDQRTFVVGDAQLTHPRFSAHEARAARYRPRRSLERYPGGAFSLGPADPQAMPVLFVHGYAGYAQQFETLVESVPDGSQPWVFQYAFAVRLEETASRIRDAIEEMQIRYGVQEVAVVAHSAGGVAARRAMALLGRHSPVRCFASLASPMAGIDKAAFGIRRSPVVVPIWRDLEPQSAFLSRLFSRPVNAHRYLLVTARLDDPDLEEPGDGVVAIRSQQRAEAVAAATTRLHVEDSHEGLLRNEQVHNTLHEFLRGCLRR